MNPTVELIACVHSQARRQALIYVRTGPAFYRISKQVSGPLEYIRFKDRSHCVEDARNMTRFAPDFLYYDSINNAPINQVQLEAMISTMRGMGHLRYEQGQGKVV